MRLSRDWHPGLLNSAHDNSNTIATICLLIYVHTHTHTHTHGSVNNIEPNAEKLTSILWLERHKFKCYPSSPSLGEKMRCKEMKCREVILNSWHLLLSRQLLVCKQFAETIVPEVDTQSKGLTSLTVLWRDFPGGPAVKNPPVQAGDVGLIPESRRSPGEGNGKPLQYSCLGNPTDRGAWRATVHEVARTRHNLATKQQQIITRRKKRNPSNSKQTGRSLWVGRELTAGKSIDPTILSDLTPDFLRLKLLTTCSL